MRLLLGLTIIALLTSCAANRAVSTAGGATTDALAHSTGPTADFDLLTVRVGVEFLPTGSGRTGHGLGQAGIFGDTSSLTRPSFRVAQTTGPATAGPVTINPIATGPVSVVPLHGRPHPSAVAELGAHDRLTEAWIFEQAENRSNSLDAITDRFYDDVVGPDGVRVHRQFGTPVLLTRSWRPQMRTVRSSLDDQLEDERAQFDHRVLSSLMMGPLRRAMRKASILAEFEADFYEFTGRNDEPIQSLDEQGQSVGVEWGRPTARLHLSDSSDPLELGYRNFGFDVSSTQSYIRLGYQVRLFEKLSANIRWKGGYSKDVGDFLRAELEWTFDSRNYLHITAGDDLEYLGGPTAYTFLDSPIDGSRGALFFVEHMF